MIEEVRAGAFRVLRRFPYLHQLPETEDCGENLEVGEMARVADRFQAVELCAHCVGQYTEGMEVCNVVQRLVLAHDSGLVALEQAAMQYFVANALVFEVCCLPTCLSPYPVCLLVDLLCESCGELSRCTVSFCIVHV